MSNQAVRVAIKKVLCCDAVDQACIELLTKNNIDVNIS